MYGVRALKQDEQNDVLWSKCLFPAWILHIWLYFFFLFYFYWLINCPLCDIRVSSSVGSDRSTSTPQKIHITAGRHTTVWWQTGGTSCFHRNTNNTSSTLILFSVSGLLFADMSNLYSPVSTEKKNTLKIHKQTCWNLSDFSVSLKATFVITGQE